MDRVFMLIVCLLAVALPAWAQDEADASQAKRIEELIAGFKDEDGDGVIYIPKWAMTAEAIPVLILLLSNEDQGIRSLAAFVLEAIGPEAAPAVPALIASLSDDPVTWREPPGAHGLPMIVTTRIPAASALDKIGTSLKAEGTILWWVVPRVYWKQILSLLLFIPLCFVFFARFPRYRPASKLKHLILIVSTAAVPVFLSCSAVYYAITREWTQGFMPDAVTVVPFPVAAVLSVALVCVLPAVWVCQRKRTADADPSASG